MISASTPWSTMLWMSEISLLRSDSALVTMRSMPRAAASSRIDWVSAMRNGLASRSDWAKPIGGTAEVDGLDARAAVLVVAAVLSGRRGDLLADPARGTRRRGALRRGSVATGRFGAFGGRQALAAPRGGDDGKGWQRVPFGRGATSSWCSPPVVRARAAR